MNKYLLYDSSIISYQEHSWDYKRKKPNLDPDLNSDLVFFIDILRDFFYYEDFLVMFLEGLHPHREIASL